jgi:hypothetical protein
MALYSAGPQYFSINILAYYAKLQSAIYIDNVFGQNICNYDAAITLATLCNVTKIK